MLSTEQIIDKTNELGAHNYHPKDVVIVEADGVVVKDPEGREYYDMLSASLPTISDTCTLRL